MEIENRLLEQGYRLIVGVDEAGYGAWAGPVAVGAACLPLSEDVSDLLHGVKDSKQMTSRQRTVANTQIQEIALGWGVGHATPQEIVKIGIKPALFLAMQRAFHECAAQLDDEPEYLILDGIKQWKNATLPIEAVEHVKDGDKVSLTIAAGSVLAKVWRDQYMIDLAEKYPLYGFDKHKGYGTAAHLSALRTHGVLKEIHRTTYTPIRAIIDAALSE